MLYVLVFVSLILLACIFDFSARRNRVASIYYGLAIAVLTAIAGLRYRMAPDSVWYMHIFETETVSLRYLTWSELTTGRYQPLWTLLASLCKGIGGYYFFQTVVAAIHLVSVGVVITRTTEKRFTALTLYFVLCYFYFAMDILRESLAIAMFLIAAHYYVNNRLVKFGAFSVFAILFHQYAFAAVLLLPLFDRRTPKSYQIGLVCAIPLLNLFGVNLVEAIVKTISSTTRSDLYSYDSIVNMSFQGYLYYLLKVLPLAVLVFIFRGRTIQDCLLPKSAIVGLVACYIGLVLMRISVHPYLERIINYFILFPIIFFASTVPRLLQEKLSKDLARPALSGILVSTAVYYIAPMINRSAADDTIPYRRYYPYSSVFDMDTDPEREHAIRVEAKEPI